MECVGWILPTCWRRISRQEPESLTRLRDAQTFAGLWLLVFRNYLVFYRPHKDTIGFGDLRIRELFEVKRGDVTSRFRGLHLSTGESLRRNQPPSYVGGYKADYFNVARNSTR